MDRFNKLAELLRESGILTGYANKDIATYCMARTAYQWEFEEHVNVPGYEWGESSIEYLEEAYKRGYAAIIHDGHLLGFKKEKAC